MEEPEIVCEGQQQKSVDQAPPLGAMSLGSIARRQSRHVVDEIEDSPSYVPAAQDSQVVRMSTTQTTASQQV